MISQIYSYDKYVIKVAGDLDKIIKKFEVRPAIQFLSIILLIYPLYNIKFNQNKLEISSIPI